MNDVPKHSPESALPTARSALAKRIGGHLEFIYPDLQVEKREALLTEIMMVMRFDTYIAHPEEQDNRWTQLDVLLITYGDTIVDEGRLPLRVLREFLREKFTGFVSSVHILPFFPWSSDDGFAVLDYLAVNEELGTWDEIVAIAGDFQLMADLVINHCSSQSVWFENFKKRIDPGRDYFIEQRPDAHLHEVVRPRVSPLLRPTDTAEGQRHVWCTFSHDQVDLDFHNPRVLLEFACILRFYLDRGVKIFRLDAVAYLWKEIGTRCINLPQTHEVIRLLRTLIEHCDPEAIIITETNIPNLENLSYFGTGNEAHCIYNFSLPPLLIYALASGDCSALRTWLLSMPPAQSGTAYLNFIASHDGIGLRPAEGLLEDEKISDLAELMQSYGGDISWRSISEEVRRPYEINIALFDAFKGTFESRPAVRDDQVACTGQIERFLCAHTIMLALEGIPALYIHSFFGTQNDHAGVARSGHSRAINRHQWRLPDLQHALSDPSGHHGEIMARMRRLVDIRRRQPAFHPNVPQSTLPLDNTVFGFWRRSRDSGGQSIFCLNNVSDEPQSVPLQSINLGEHQHWEDLLSDLVVDALDGELLLAPYQCVWLSNRPKDAI